MDYCNSLFRGLSCFNLHKLQCIQNTAAPTSHRKYGHVTSILKAACQLPLNVHNHNFGYKFLHSGPSFPLYKSNTLAIVLASMLPGFGMNFKTMYAVQHLLPPSGKNLKLTCLQKTICHSLPVIPDSSLVLPDSVIGLMNIDLIYFRLSLSVSQIHDFAAKGDKCIF